MERITSRQHPVIRRFRALAARRDDASVLLDGDHLVGDALEAGVALEIVLTGGRARDLAARAAAAGAAVYETTASVMAAASPVRAPSGIVAIATWHPEAAAAVLAGSSALVLGLVGVQDPGNAGSAIRSAYALGATGVAVLDGSADPGAWKTLRGAMGATFRLPVARAPLVETLALARARGLTIVATVAQGGQPLGASRLDRPALVLVGNEGSGLADQVVERADVRLTIPMRRGAESLNVAVTSALVLWEARRTDAGRTESP